MSRTTTTPRQVNRTIPLCLTCPRRPRKAVVEVAGLPVNIYITVEGSADEAVVEDLKTKLHDTVKELFEEFRNEENEEMALKEQYAF